MSKRDEILDGLVAGLESWRCEATETAEAFKTGGHESEANACQCDADTAAEQIAAIQQLRAKAAELEKQVEFLEWMARAESMKSLSIVILPERKVFVFMPGSSDRIIAAWPGQLRDGRQHWNAIKEAVK